MKAGRADPILATIDFSLEGSYLWGNSWSRYDSSSPLTFFKNSYLKNNKVKNKIFLINQKKFLL